jgi:DNA-binding transcriptional LysR family regulator
MRQDINRLRETEIFVRVVAAGSFSAAARALRMTPSAVSKLIARLEDRLGARLVARSTRKLQLTPEGAAFYERGVAILDDMDAAEREAAAGARPRGRLRVNLNVAFARHVVLPLIPDFLARYPEITIDITVSDRVVDLLEERADVAIRIGPLRESRLIARKLGESRNVIVGSPAYLARHGAPRTPKDLAGHNCLGFCFTRHVSGWPLLDEVGGVVTIPPVGNTQVSDGETMRELALAGLGIARLSAFHVDADIAAGRLVPVLDAYNPGDVEPVNAIFVSQGGHLPARVRVFLDYLAETVSLG